MTTRELQAVLDALAKVAADWNDEARRESGRLLDASLCLTLSSDGSGRLGERHWPATGKTTVDDLRHFPDADALARLLADEGVEIAPEAEPASERDLAELRRLEAETTPGPWVADKPGDSAWDRGRVRVVPENGPWHLIAETVGTTDANAANAAFIAAARNHLRGLLARLDLAEGLLADRLMDAGKIDQATRPLHELRSEVARLREALAEVVESCNVLDRWTDDPAAGRRVATLRKLTLAALSAAPSESAPPDDAVVSREELLEMLAAAEWDYDESRDENICRECAAVARRPTIPIHAPGCRLALALGKATVEVPT